MAAGDTIILVTVQFLTTSKRAIVDDPISFNAFAVGSLRVTAVPVSPVARVPTLVGLAC